MLLICFLLNPKTPITNPEMTRFWIPLEQGPRFVMDCVDRMVGGEVFVPKIPSMKLGDVAKAIAKDAKWEVIGIRPGEKLHEKLITSEETERTREFDRYFVINADHTYWNPGVITEGKPVDFDFEYSSNTNSWWITTEELHRHIDDLQVEC